MCNFNLVLKRCFFNENIKKLIIASVLSMITASCYAGSIVVGSDLPFSPCWMNCEIRIKLSEGV
ncbi:hypothetical protein EJ624_17080 [Salmonella enterica]|nr:hypothetical protein [Salmonella enterica]EDN1815662.1 hypothetical protein [Salmonella enterica]